MEKAKELLIQNSDRSVQQIAADVGFSTPGYFATKFKSTFQSLPPVFVAIPHCVFLIEEQSERNQTKKA